MAAVGYGGKSLTAKPKRCYFLQIVEFLDFTGCESFAQDRVVFPLDAVAIVLDLKQAKAALLAEHVYLSSPSINRVLNELLESSRW